MATTTPNFGWDIPQSTDLVKDGATAIAALGTDIDTALVDLKGGTTGQVLSKASNTDLDFSWVSDATGIPATIFDAKGDIIAATAADTAGRLASSAVNGDVLTVDTSTATGLKWATPAAGAPTQLILQTTGEYIGTPASGNMVSRVATEDVTYYVPIYLNGITFDRIACATSSTFSGTATVRLGIYNASLTTGKPTTVYLDAGTVSCTAASTNYTITINSTPPAGIYFLAFNMQTAATTPNFIGASGTLGAVNYFVRQQYSTLAAPPNGTNQYPYQSSVTGAFGTASISGTTDTPIFTFLRMA